MKKTTLYSKDGGAIVAPDNRIEYLTHKGWLLSPPRSKRKDKETEETE